MTLDRRKMLAGAVGASAAFMAAQAESTKGEIKQAQYVIVELLGYKRLCGRMSQGAFGLLQLDIPADGGTITQLINPQSVYRITVVDSDTVSEYAKSIDPLPPIAIEYPVSNRALPFADDDENGSAF